MALLAYAANDRVNKMLSIVAPIMLAIVMIMADGATYQRNIEYKSLEACWAAAHLFMQSKRADLRLARYRKGSEAWA